MRPWPSQWRVSPFSENWIYRMNNHWILTMIGGVSEEAPDDYDSLSEDAPDDYDSPSEDAPDGYDSLSEDAANGYDSLSDDAPDGYDNPSERCTLWLRQPE
ncbi:Os07g0586400 [Oryza sativa Japonica Group]|uniref:Os07g0586400 protein n=1 Tax=Oryza sativa subsp. japonica TaxID=39947 RepID=A0A0N7KNS0_ORYSJ|nr:Os07g0586400 [Oryza sativa Japonica Group]